MPEAAWSVERSKLTTPEAGSPLPVLTVAPEPASGDGQPAVTVSIRPTPEPPVQAPSAAVPADLLAAGVGRAAAVTRLAAETATWPASSPVVDDAPATAAGDARCWAGPGADLAFALRVSSRPGRDPGLPGLQTRDAVAIQSVAPPNPPAAPPVVQALRDVGTTAQEAPILSGQPVRPTPGPASTPEAGPRPGQTMPACLPADLAADQPTTAAPASVWPRPAGFPAGEGWTVGPPAGQTEPAGALASPARTAFLSADPETAAAPAAQPRTEAGFPANQTTTVDQPVGQTRTATFAAGPTRTVSPPADQRPETGQPADQKIHADLPAGQKAPAGLPAEQGRTDPAPAGREMNQAPPAARPANPSREVPGLWTTGSPNTGGDRVRQQPAGSEAAGAEPGNGEGRDLEKSTTVASGGSEAGAGGEGERDRGAPARALPAAAGRAEAPALTFHPDEGGRPPAAPGSKPPTAEAATRGEAPETAAASQNPGQPARKISLQVSGPQSDERVAVDLVDRGGKLHVAVRARSDDLTESLRQGLPELVTRLQRSGYGAESWVPGAARSDRGEDTAERGLASGNETRPQGARQDPAPEQGPHHEERHPRPPSWVDQVRPKRQNRGEESFLWHLKSIR